MNHEDMYHGWVQAKSQVDVSPGFSDRVMKRIGPEPAHASQRVLSWSRLIERISISAWAKVAAIAIASILGIGRILLTLHLLLSV